MARTAAGAELTERHRQGQLKIRARALRSFLALWLLWRGQEATFDQLARLTVPIVLAHHNLSSTLAVAYYTQFRRAERVAGKPSPRLAPPLPEGQVLASLFVTGEQMTRRAREGGASPQQAQEKALVRTSGAVGRLALQGGRDATILSAAEDGQARGWTRITSGSPCAFCTMVASNGAVYSADTADFQTHDHCGCSASPVYDGDRLPQAERHRETYNAAQREARAAGELASGTSNDQLNAVRRYLNDRK